MSRKATSGFMGKLAAGIAGAALVLGVPTAGLAIGLGQDGANAPSLANFAVFTPASVDPEIARMVAERGSTLRMKRFTPAGATTADRSVTVAVRVNPEAARAITVRSAIASAAEATDAPVTRITSTRYNLGLARGYRSFAQAPALSQPLSQAAIPDISQFEPSVGVREEPSRFAARIALEEERQPAPAAERSLDSLGDQRLDVAGSYRLTRNLDVTAGVRYQQDRDRRLPLSNLDQQDSQAVYIGTQFRF